MKRQRSYGEDLAAVGDKGVLKDWGRRGQDPDRSFAHRRFCPKADGGRRGSYDRSLDDDRELGRPSWKRFDHESDGFDRRKGFDRYDRMMPASSPRNVYCGPEKIHRSESFSRRDFPKGFRSWREPTLRKENVSSWRRSVGNGGKDVDEDPRSGNRVGSEDRGSSRSSAGSRDVGKSPPWSKDSSVEQSKSIELEKMEEANGESNRGSEMEEGELEPDPELKPEQEPQKEAGSTKCQTRSGMKMEDAESSDGEKLEIEGKQEDEMFEAVTGTSRAEEVNEVPDCEVDTAVELLERDEDVEAKGSREKDENAEEECTGLPSPYHEPESRRKEEINEEISIEKPLPLEEEQKQGRSTDLGIKAGGANLPNPNKEATEENDTPKLPLRLMTDELTDKGKDKGKGLAVSTPDEGNSMEVGGWMTRDLMVGRDDVMAGPSTGSLELFLFSDVTRQESKNHSGDSQNKDERLRMEPLELSLGLPGISIAPASHNPVEAPKLPSHAPNSPTHGRSVHSLPTTFRTSSDGFTASISCSGSQTLFHNPSCSLTHNSFENYEQSVGSHPIFQGVDQVPHITRHGQSSNEPKCKEISLCPRMLQNGNGARHASQATRGRLNSQAVQGQYVKVSEGSTGIPNGMDQRLILSRQLSGQLRQDDVKSPPHSVGSHETRSEHTKDRKQVMRESNSGSLLTIGQRETGQLVLNGTNVFERIIAGIVSEPIQIMAGRIEKMTDQSISSLKESVNEIIHNRDKHKQLRALQEALQRRSDLTLGALMNCHRVQVEILVALKTGLRDFLRPDYNIPSSVLVEIFLNLKCRNLACQSMLSMDECDCKFCVQKNGFCRDCMCLVCSKFDMASNTCSWVGCDVCYHWCHTDCGLRDSHIRNGLSVMGAQGTTEMQFHCIACDHPSEMFGFVKEVFKTCAQDWKAETLSKELEYVRRIFHASEDARGKQLHDVAVQMLVKLENKSNLTEVYSSIISFLTESDSKFGNSPSTISVKELYQTNPGEGSNGIVGPSQEAARLRYASTEKARAGENSGSILPRFDWDRMGNQTGVPELQPKVEKRPVVDELESIVRIKQAEAEMFQARADNARREAEGLKRIANAKNEKFEREHAIRISKLCLVEAEERRKQKLEELQVLEKAHLEYFNMKMRMETDIKDLLLKMEATKRNLHT
ncbi:protein OBERON 4-like [Magnolia sinica]|uniref:protein OBERON 4-like n=1 Tax=Magnolia sinica TaxID=86752 RepID=UPI002658E81A|nr:protein OBERON 4-like [Magnolia sinica]